MVDFLRKLYSLPETEMPGNRMKCCLNRCRKAYGRMQADGLSVEDFFDKGKDGRKRKTDAVKQVAPRHLTCMRGARAPATGMVR